MGIIAVLLALAAAGCAKSKTASPPATTPAVPHVSVSEAVARMDRGEAVLIDVRERDEVIEGMAAPAIWLPMSSINSDDAVWRGFLDTMQEHPDRQVIAYCRSGNRSGQVAAELAARGYKVANMGGFSDWVASGQPTKRPDNPEPGK